MSNAYRDTRRAAGLCAYCGAASSTPCPACRRKRNAWHLRWRQRRRALSLIVVRSTFTLGAELRA